MSDNPAILVFSTDGATDLFQTTVKVIPLHTLHYSSWLHALHYVRPNQELWRYSSRMKSSRFPSKHVKDLDYVEDIAVLVNHINTAEKLLSTLETGAR